MLRIASMFPLLVEIRHSHNPTIEFSKEAQAPGDVDREAIIESQIVSQSFEILLSFRHLRENRWALFRRL